MQNEFILSVNWQADKIKNFAPPVKKAKFLTNKPAVKDDDRENVILNKDEKIELMQMFKPNGVIADIFKKYEKGYERYFNVFINCSIVSFEPLYSSLNCLLFIFIQTLSSSSFIKSLTSYG
jgi:hypothetical protein